MAGCLESNAWANLLPTSWRRAAAIRHENVSPPFARRHGLPDQLLVETPEGRVARYIERAIEERLGLSDEPVRGELRLAY